MTWWTLIPQTLILLFVCSTMQPFSEMAAGSSANTGSSLQLKHRCKNCLAWSVMLYCAITNLTILENAGTENASSVFQCLLLGLSFRKYSRSGNENRLPHNQSCSTGHGCESRFGPGRRRGLICCLFFFFLSMQNSHWNSCWDHRSGLAAKGSMLSQHLSCWTRLARGKGGLEGVYLSCLCLHYKLRSRIN